MLARLSVACGDRLPDRFIFEEEAGPVLIDLLHEDGEVVGAELL